MVDRGPEVSYAVGQDVIVTHQQRLWPGSDFSDLPLELAGLAPPVPAPADAPAPLSGAPSAQSSLSGAEEGAWAPPPPGYYSFWCVFDGHNGVAAASMAAEHVTEMLEELLPYGPPEAPDSPYYSEWCEEVQRSLAECVAALNLLFAGRGIVAGCTATLVIQVGWLVTCANVGDSRALLDTGAETITMTVDHRVATHKAERRRVEAMGATIAPIDFSGNGPAQNVNNGVGPLRIWPGGLCLSRAVGDFDVGESVIPLPHIYQCILPPTGGRIMIASDGVWDAFDKMTKVGTMSRAWPLETAADRMVQTITRTYGGLRDDTSIIIVDITPPGKTFLEVVQQVSGKGRSSKLPVTAAAGSAPPSPGSAAPAKRAKSGGCLCFGGGFVEEEVVQPTPRALTPNPSLPLSDSPNPSVSHRGRLAVLANYDVAGVMGLMPDDKVDPPGWYSPEVGERLFRMMAESTIVWKEAVRTGSRHGPSPNPSLHRGSLLASLGTGGLQRAPSLFFQGAVAETEEEYANMFGHYSKELRPVPSARPDSRDASVRSGAESSVRAGGRFMDPSVRAGNRYFDPSVRAGRAYFEGASVRAGRAYYAAAAGGSQHGGGASEASVRGGGGGGTSGRSVSRMPSEAASLDSAYQPGESAQEEAARRQSQEDALGLAPIRTVRFGAVESLGPQKGSMQRQLSGGLPSAALASAPMPAEPRAAKGDDPLVGESGMGRRGSGAVAALAAAAAAEEELLAAGGGGAEDGSRRGGGSKAVRFAARQDSPVDHFVGLSHTSSLLSAVEEEQVA